MALSLLRVISTGRTGLNCPLFLFSSNASQMATSKTNRIQDLLKSLGQIHGDVSVSDANRAIRRPVSHDGDHQPKLLWDLLLYILQFLRRADVSSFVLTCRTAYEHGVPFLARRYGFDVGREPEVMSLTRFCSFMLGSPLRPHFLRELCISAGYIDVLDGAALVPQQVQCIMEALAEVIRQAVNLEVLHIPLLHPEPYNNPQKDFSPYILPSLGSLTKLREFVLSDPGETGLSVLENIRSPLQKVVLGLYNPPFEDIGRGEINILPHVAIFSGSLEVLELEYACSGAVSFKSDGIQFQHVHTLTLSYRTPKIIGLCLDDLFATFPSLRVLELPINTYLAEIEDPDEEYSDQELEALRVTQRRRRADRWPSFDNLICPIRWAYGAVPPKANTWQRFDLGDSDANNWDMSQRGCVARDETNIKREIAQFHALLEDIRPVHLDLMTYAYVTQIPGWLPSLGVAGLTHLNLELFWTHRLYCESGGNWLRNLLVRKRYLFFWDQRLS
ncbi:hypothetical protein BXZ70DRAFT_374154 [Cristinia sonorae]|uniref:F-box domain-containing protein n=1 Tax=Cristinia sonorae TaxID=1940300 RepID=A0A8K0XMQ6_9AGAR|nr:hypothetical protein BXZ70DRAFT_374154 [Cristinia sonorae]